MTRPSRPAASRTITELALVGLAGCVVLGAGCRGDSWAGTIERRDGVLYVSNPTQGLWQARERTPLRFELEQTFGVDQGPRDAILAPIDSIDVDGDGTVYVLSSAPSRLVAFATDGTVRWSSDQRGQGPGDLSKPYGLAWDGATSLYLTNQSGARLDIWSIDGAFRESHSMSENFHYLLRVTGFLADGRLVLNGDGGETADAAVVVYEAGSFSTPTAKFFVDVTDQRGERGGVLATVVVADDLIIVGDYDSYEVRWFTGDGKLARVWTRDFHKLTGIAVFERSSIVFSWLSPPLQLGPEHWLTRASWTEADDVDATFARMLRGGEPPVHRNALDLFDAEGRLLYTLEADGATPDIGRPARTDAAGHLYTIVDDPYPHVRRYSVAIGR